MKQKKNLSLFAQMAWMLSGARRLHKKNRPFCVILMMLMTMTAQTAWADGEEPVVLPEGTIYVSENGSDENDGSSEESAIATLAHAVDIVKAREDKTATVYVLNGDYTTDAIDISDDVGVSLSIIGQEKGEVTIQGTGAYVFDIYGENLAWSFKNLDFVDLESTARTSAALVLYSKNGNFTVDNCGFRNIDSKLGAIAIGNDDGNTNVTNCVIEEVTGSASSTAIITVNGDGTYIFDNVEIKNCNLHEEIASSNTASYLRTLIYVNTYEADVTISNSRICGNVGPAMSLIESRSKLTIVNTTISDNVVNASANGSNGGDNLIWANNDNSDINISHCVITNNAIVKPGKGLFYNQKGSINVEYCDISNNVVDSFVGAAGTITANNNWWGTNDQPDAKVDSWVIMNVEADDSDLSQNNKVTLTVDFNHVKTSSGTVEELTGGEIPKDSYVVEVSAQNGEISPASMVVQKGEVQSQVFTVTNVNDVITLTCDGAQVEIPLVTVLSETTGITDAASLKGKTAQFTRTFTAGVASTICLPFPMTSITGGTAYEFTAMEKVSNVWTATMTNVTETEASKPYLFKASADGAVSFSGTVPSDFTGVAASSDPVQYSEGGTWTFRGTYTTLTYGTNLDGAVYGFAGAAYSSISAGDFVKAEAGAYVSPFRCYLTYNAPSSARGMTRGADIELPSRIIVRLVGSNGQTTAIGSMDTKTGEVVFGNEWYTLDGRKLNGKPNAKGMYINNGKKIVVK